MRKIALFAVAATLALAGIGAWAASTTHARVDVPAGDRIDPAHLTMNAKELPAAEFVDYTFVFD